MGAEDPALTTFNRYPRPLPTKAVQIPTDTMEQEFATHYRRGFEARGKQLDVEIEALKKQRDQLLAAIEYALAIGDGAGPEDPDRYLEEKAIDWLRDWSEGDVAAMAQLDAWIARRAAHDAP